MRRRWLTWNVEVMGDWPGTYWHQSWGCTRADETGLWTVHDRRSMPGRQLMIDEWTFGTTSELVTFLIDEWPHLTVEDILEGSQTWPRAALDSIVAALAERGHRPDDDPLGLRSGRPRSRLVNVSGSSCRSSLRRDPRQRGPQARSDRDATHNA